MQQLITPIVFTMSAILVILVCWGLNTFRLTTLGLRPYRDLGRGQCAVILGQLFILTGAIVLGCSNVAFMRLGWIPTDIGTMVVYLSLSIELLSFILIFAFLWSRKYG